MSMKKEFSINLIASVIAFIVNIGINFLITPYIIKTIGVEAYGFVSLGSNFINYATLVTIALNSMAGRFITIEIHRDNWKAANMYFNSVLMANIIVAGVLLIPSILCVAYVEKIVNVPFQILTDVRILFLFLFANFLISIIVSTFGVATFATNKLYLQSLRSVESSIIKVVLLIILFTLLKPAVSFLGFATFIALLYTTFFNIYYAKKLLPKIEINKLYFSYKSIIELILSGLWNTITRVGQILLEGVDLLIANIYINSSAMGTLALAKTVPTIIISFVGVVANVFMPDFTILYAQKKTDELVKAIKRSMTLLGIIVTIPISILVAFGQEFFRLWVPSEDPKILQVLSVITIATIVVSGSINSIYGVFTVTNKLKANAVALLLTGVINLAIVFLLLNVTNLGIYAIAGVSTILSIVRNLIFTLPYGAKCLNLKWNEFFPEIIKSIAAFIVVTTIGLFIRRSFIVTGWIGFFGCSALTVFLGLIVNFIVILKKSERDYLFGIISNRLANKKKCK